LSIAAHEIRTPLMAMQLQLDLVLEQGVSLEPKLRSKIERASRNAQRLADLAAALLDVGRIAAGKMTLNPMSTDISALVRDVLDRLHEAAVAAKCEIDVTIESNVIAVVDALRVGQVVSNLLANAFKYAMGTRVEVSLHASDGRFVLRVRDHGPGIAAEDRERIFARFERASARSLGGLGLGLYVVHQIVSAHGGAITVDGPEGGGALFTVDLPLHTRTVPVEAA
jgi:signal transduction histidine kinase